MGKGCTMAWITVADKMWCENKCVKLEQLKLPEIICTNRGAAEEVDDSHPGWRATRELQQDFWNNKEVSWKEIKKYENTQPWGNLQWEESNRAAFIVHCRNGQSHPSGWILGHPQLQQAVCVNRGTWRPRSEGSYSCECMTTTFYH